MFCLLSAKVHALAVIESNVRIQTVRSCTVCTNIWELDLRPQLEGASPCMALGHTAPSLPVHGVTSQMPAADAA